MAISLLFSFKGFLIFFFLKETSLIFIWECKHLPFCKYVLSSSRGKVTPIQLALATIPLTVLTLKGESSQAGLIGLHQAMEEDCSRILCVQKHFAASQSLVTS